MLLMGMVALVAVFFVHFLNLTRDVKELKKRLAHLEASTSAAQPPPQPTPQPADVAPPEPSEPPSIPPVPLSEPVKPVPAHEEPAWDLEALIGGSWLNRIGVVLVLFGVAFFLKYAFDNRWIGETGRVILGFVAGLIFLGLGERYQRQGYRRFSQGLTGGGIGIFYLSVYAAFGFYHLIPQAAAFVFMILVTIAGVALAVRYDALPIAVFATLGGFLTPFLLSTGVDNQVALFTYVLLLNLGVLAVAYFRNWHVLNYQGFIFTVITFSAWAIRFYETSKLWTTFFFLTLFFLVFAFLAILHNIVHRRRASAPELILAFLNAGIYFAASYFLLEYKYGDYLGLFSLAMGGAYVALAYLTNARHAEDRFLVWVFLGLAATFVTLAVPIQLKQNWITVGWAIEGAVLAYIGFRYQSRNTLLASLAILALVSGRLMVVDVHLHLHPIREEFLLLLNRRGLSFGISIAAMLLAAHLFANRPLESFAGTRIAAGCLLIAANVLALVLLSVESHDYFEHLHFQQTISPTAFRYAQQMSLSIIWGVYAGFLIVAGVRKGYRPMRYMALLLFGITIFKVFFIDLSELERFYRIISFLVLGVILIAVSFLYQNYREALIGPGTAERNME
jgi:uncharacterized membrane protein